MKFYLSQSLPAGEQLPLAREKTAGLVFEAASRAQPGANEGWETNGNEAASLRGMLGHGR